MEQGVQNIPSLSQGVAEMGPPRESAAAGSIEIVAVDASDEAVAFSPFSAYSGSAMKTGGTTTDSTAGSCNVYVLRLGQFK